MSKEEYKDEIKEEKPGGSSRLGKEAKIGVTVIALLLIVFGVVVVVRLRGSNADDKPAVAADREDGRERARHEGKTEAMFKENRSKPFGGGVPPTVVPAKATSAKPPKTTAGDLDQWKLASDRGEAKRSGGGPSPSTPPPFMPEPPKPPQPERHERHALDPPAASGYASVEAAPAPPAYREPPRYEHPPAPPASFRTGTSYSVGEERSTPAMAVAQYDPATTVASPQNPGVLWRAPFRASLYNNRAARRDDGKYEVQPNDSYWTISERLYGTGAYFKALAQQNRGKGAGEDRLQPGELILAPTVAELEKSYPDLCPKPSRREALQSQSQSRASTVSARNQYRGGRTYTVAEGDTLFNIARYELGKASRWAEIYDLNRDVLGKDFNYLTPGIQLALPEGEKSDVIAQPPGNVYRR